MAIRESGGPSYTVVRLCDDSAKQDVGGDNELHQDRSVDKW